ncbi:Chromo domain [Fusarium acutatum]|uniref:Chromo domain n=1 Tax=Fusarium acutatum TaxID=78861 RepID=A0A8H4J9A2_9HYPO|nr:Chromo domain [Fusarium acutatum]
MREDQVSLLHYTHIERHRYIPIHYKPESSPADRTLRGHLVKKARIDSANARPSRATTQSPDDKPGTSAVGKDTIAKDQIKQDPDTYLASVLDPDPHKPMNSETTTNKPHSSQSIASEPDFDEIAVSQVRISRAGEGTEASMVNQDKASKVASGRLDLTGVDLATDLHSIIDYKVDGEFLLKCRLRIGTNGWVPEERLQIGANFTLNTFWESRENINGRPHDKVNEKVFQIIPQEFKENGNQICIIRRIGEPYFFGTYDMMIYLTTLKEKWKAHVRLPKIIGLEQAKELYPDPSLWCEEMTGSLNSNPVPQMIFSHRKNLKDKECEFQFFILYDSRVGEWMSEVTIQELYPAAVETYWQSHPGLREEQSLERPRVPERCFKIVGHKLERGDTLLKVHLVGKSDHEGDIKVIKALKSLELWEQPTQSYLEEHKLQI